MNKNKKGFDGTILWMPTDGDWTPILERMEEKEKELGRKMTPEEQTQFLVDERWKGNIRYIMVEEKPEKIMPYLQEHLLDAKVRDLDKVREKRREEK